MDKIDNHLTRDEAQELVMDVVELLGSKVNAIEKLKRQFDEHRDGAVISCDQECFCHNPL